MNERKSKTWRNGDPYTERLDNEESFFSDVILQLRQGIPKVYVYNKNIINNLICMFPDINIQKKDFYWEVINDEYTKTCAKQKSRNNKKQDNYT